MTAEENEALAISWFEATLSGDFDRWLGMMSDDFRYWYGGKWYDRASYVAVATRLSRELVDGDYTMRVGAVTAQDDRVVVEADTSYDIQGGGRYRNFYCFVVQVRDGKILSVKSHLDTLHAFRLEGRPETSAEGESRESPVEAVTRTLAGPPPQPRATA